MTKHQAEYWSMGKLAAEFGCSRMGAWKVLNQGILPFVTVDNGNGAVSYAIEAAIGRRAARIFRKGGTAGLRRAFDADRAA